MKGLCKDALHELNEYEKKRDPQVADICLHRFAVVVGALGDHVKHPRDMDKALADADFFAEMKRLVDGIKRFDLIKLYEQNHPTSIAGQAEMFRRYLMSMEIYFASQS